MKNRRKIIIHVNHLKLGMYVCELDRPWLGTPFLFQGFCIRKQEQIDKLQAFCDSVYVDVDKSLLVPGKTSATPLNPHLLKRQVYALSATFEQEITVANEIRETTRGTVENLFEDVSKGSKIDLLRVRKIVHETVDGVLRNPDAHLCITQLKNRDDYTAQHSINVCVLALALGRYLGLPRDQLEMLGIAALLHDIGKIKTPLEVLNKPGRLTPQEFEIVKVHTLDGHDLLRQRYGLPNRIAQTAISHHERLGGGGYPRGLKGSEIPVWGKIVAIVDVYDAITSDRIYHQGVAPTEALTKMYGWRLTDFDAELLEQFIQCVGIYPVGTLVQLTDGQVGLVTSVNQQFRLLPKVKLLLNSEKRSYRRDVTLDLADIFAMDPETTCRIEKVLMPRAYGIKIREHLAPDQQPVVSSSKADVSF